MRLAKGHPGTFDEPRTQLELALMAFRARQIDASRFLEDLFNSQVFVLPKREDINPGDEGFKLAKNPHLFSITYPEYVALGLYTHQDRMKPTCDQYPEFRFGVEVQAGEFLMDLQSDFGVVLNPYWDVNIEWSNEQMRRIVAMVRRD